VSVVGVLGDMHGNRDVMVSTINRFADTGVTTIIQVGDLGVWPGDQSTTTFNHVNDTLTTAGIHMLVAPGNHEDYDQIRALTPNSDGWLEFRDHMWLAPRGLRTTLHGHSVLWLGGAGSVDRTLRQRMDAVNGTRSWWPAEAITAHEAADAVAGGRATIMVCHDAPTGVPQIDARIQSGAQGQFLASDVVYATESRTHLTTVVDQVKPEMLLHGHYHFPVDDYREDRDGHTTHIVGLDRDSTPGVACLLNLATLTVEPLPQHARTRLPGGEHYGTQYRI